VVSPWGRYFRTGGLAYDNKQLKAGLIVELSSRYSTMFLYSKEGQITTIGTRLQKTEPIHNKEQDTTTLNWRSN